MVTRRCTQRQFLLVPSIACKQIFLYCLALAQQATQMSIHAVCVMSNHYHIIVSDEHARLPKFTYILNKFVAKCINAHYERWENVWAAGTQASYVLLGDDDALLDKMIYTVTNPVAAGLVSRVEDWPGLLLWRPGRYKAKRPDVFFTDDMPQTLWLELTPLPLERNTLRAREVGERVGAAVAAKQKQIRAEMRAAGRKFLGANAVLRQRHTDSPTSAEPHRKLSPRVASRDKWRRIELLARLKSFVDSYRTALRQWLDGDRDTVFPAGTYKLRVEYGIRCADC